CGWRLAAAVLADPGRVAANVAGIEGSVVEGGSEEQQEARRPPHEVRPHRVDRAPRALPRGDAGEPAPRLRERVDAALLVLRGAERRAVVEVGAAVPLAVPR